MTIETDVGRLNFLDDWDTALTADFTVIPGIFDTRYAGIDIAGSVIEADTPQFICRSSDAAALKHGNQLVIDGSLYTVRTLKSDGTGMTQIALSGPANAGAQMYVPPRWPWRGINVKFVPPDGPYSRGATPDDLDLLLETLGPALTTIELKPGLYNYFPPNYPAIPEMLTMGYEWLDSMLDRAALLGLQCWISWNCFPLADQSGWINTWGPDWWDDPTQVAQIIPTVQQVVSHFSARGAEFCGYGFVMEPHASDAQGHRIAPPLWPDLQQQIVSAIRDADLNRAIMVKPGPGAAPNNYDADFVPYDYDQYLIYLFENYYPRPYCYQGLTDNGGGIFPVQYPGQQSLATNMSAALLFGAKFRVPLLAAEFSCATWAPDGKKWISDTLRLFELAGAGWQYQIFGSANVWDMGILASSPTDVQYVGPAAPRWRNLSAFFRDISRG